MAMEERRENCTTFGDPNRRTYGVRASAASGTASYFALVSPAGTEYFLWVNTSGNLMIDTVKPDNPDSQGNIVGLQP